MTSTTVYVWLYGLLVTRVLAIGLMYAYTKGHIQFLWFDVWIGAYWDRSARVLYICPLPCVVIKLGPFRQKHGAPPDAEGDGRT